MLQNNHYISFTLTPDADHPLNLNGAVFTFAVSREGNATASRDYTVFTSINGFTSDQAVSTQTHASNPSDFVILNFTFSGSEYEAVSAPVEVRIYPHNGSWGRNLSFRQFALYHPAPQGVPDPQPSGYEIWAAINGITGDMDAIYGGIPHLVRYAFGGNAETRLSDIVPSVQVQSYGLNGLQFTIQFQRVDDPLIRYEIWFSEDLENWGYEPVWSDTGWGPQSIQIQVPDAASGFIRMAIHYGP
ncbi:MAG: hypothetical protein LR015_15010 [Verrucomicrobia bacterium]|nr:hypothetical protein [Verrucomicrobiota bacterium]